MLRRSSRRRGRSASIAGLSLYYYRRPFSLFPDASLVYHAYLVAPRTLDRDDLFRAASYFRKRELLEAASLWLKRSLIIRRSDVRRSPFGSTRRVGLFGSKILTKFYI